MLRGYIGIAFLTRNPQMFMHYAQLHHDHEVERHKYIDGPTSALALCYHHLGVANCLNHRFKDAITLLEQSKMIREDLDGSRPQSMFNSLYHLGLAWHHQGEHEEADRLLERAIKDRVEEFGPKDCTSVK